MPETMSAFYSPDELISFRQAIPNKKLSRKRSKPVEDETPRYSCTMCKYVTNRSDHYKRHLMTHSADKPLKCTMCSYGTGRSDHYKRHLQRHGLSEHEIIATCFRNGLKLKNATPVGQSLENDSHVDKSKENQDKVSTTRGEESNTVIRVEKKFKCNQCSYSTDKSSHLTRHQNSHSKSSMSRCGKCNKSFRTPYNLKDHTCHERQGHKCPKCTKMFVDRTTMMRHIVDKHHFKVAASNPVATSVSQNLSMKRHTAAGHEARMPTYSSNSVFSATRNGIGLQIKNETAALSHTSIPDDIEDHKPMDLTVTNRREIGDVVNNLVEMKIHSRVPMISNDDHRASDLMPDMPSDRGNMGCTKCGEWFNKLNEYSTHACVS